jgi:competence protein ComEC
VRADRWSGRLRDPDPDGVSLAGAVLVGVLAGTALGRAHPRLLLPTAAVAIVLAATLLRGTGGHRRTAGTRGRREATGISGHRGATGISGHRPVAGAGGHRPATGAGGQWPATGAGGVVRGVLTLALLAVAGAGVAGARATTVRGGVLAGLLSRGGTLTVEATVAEEPQRVRWGGRWVVLSVRRVEAGMEGWRTRERAGVILPESAGEVAVGDRLRISAGVERSERTDPLGGQPATVLRRPRILSRSPSRSWLLRASEAVRAAARARALDSLPPDRAGLLLGIALGDTSLEPASVDREFTTAGLTHLTAVSGQNLAVVLAAGLGIAVAFRVGRPALAILGILLIVLFALLTRWEPSVLRASAMAVLALLGVATGRGPGGRRAFCLAVTVLLLSNPSLLWSVGFQLSVAATAGVLWLGPVATRALPSRLPRVVRSAVGISLGAQAGATPVLALAFGSVSLAGLAANLMAVPIATVPMLLGVVAAAASALPPLGAVAVLACRLADPFLAALIAIAGRASSLPAASVTLSGPVRLLPGIAVLAGVVLARRSVSRVAGSVLPEEATPMR